MSAATFFLIAVIVWTVFYAVRFEDAVYRYRMRQVDAQYRAASLVLTQTRILRAGQARAAAREWGRAA